MAITTYATVPQFFTWGLPQTAMGSRTVADVQNALAAGSSFLDDYFRGRFPLPFSAVGLSVSIHTVAVGVNLFLGGRGFSPVTGADQKVIADLAAAEVWADKVQRRVLFPDVTIDPTATFPRTLDPQGTQQPMVLSYSCIDPQSGAIAPLRGW